MIRPRVVGIAFAAMLFATLAVAAVPSTPDPGPAAHRTSRVDRVLVLKARHEMLLYSGRRIVARYAVGLGTAPVGAKQREGDMRTPEGSYVLDDKNADSAYIRAIHVSYPDAADIARARRAGVRPGGAIMVHGEPNDPRVRAAVRAYPFPDWTNGCIALSNADMADFWARIEVPVPIEIRP
jgi:murein L,D-transpeptidase YafK